MMRLWCWCLAAATMLAGERWEVQYFYDQDKSSLVFQDIAFASAQRGMALGRIVKERGGSEPVVLTTTNGGTDWSPVKLREPGVSLFVLDEAHAWMPGRSGIWFSEEGGRAWRRISREKDVGRLHFVTPEHGWAIGRAKKVIETLDGGKTWKPVAAAVALDTSPERTVFYAMDFATAEAGMIVGKSHTRRRSPLPLWMDPEPERRPEWPGLSIFFETRDGGKTWKTTKSSIFGTVSEVSIDASGPGLALVQFGDFFSFPSELYRLDLKTGGNVRTLRRKDFAATDVEVKGNSALAAGFQPPGQLVQSPVPGKLRILKTTNLADWSDMDVDYRAVAGAVHLAMIDLENAWAATDTGMILRLRN